MVQEKSTLSDWVNSYTDDMYSWAFHKVSDSELAQDLVQDTFLAAAEKIDGFKGDSSPKTWLFSILNNKIVDVYRKKSKKPVTIENQSFSKFFDKNGSWNKEYQPKIWDEEEESLLDSLDFQKILQQCLNALPEKWSLCVKLKYLSGKKGEEICQEVGITTTNFWQIVHRAKLQLRDCVETNWFNN